MTPPEHPPSPIDLLRDKRALIDTGLGPVLFVAVYAIFGVNTAAIVAIGVSVLLMIERLIRGKSVVNAVGGLLGTGIAAFIAVRTGKAEAFFVPRMLIQLAYAAVFAGSAVIRRPVTGFLIAALYRAEPGWWKLPPVKRAMTELTLALGGAVLHPRRGLRGPDLPGQAGRARRGLARPGLARVRAAHVRELPLRADAARTARRARPAPRRTRTRSLTLR